MSARLRVAHRVARTGAEGPFERYALWVQGCSLRCPGCCNPALFPAAGGEALAVAELVAEIEAADVEGITVLGGEPLEQLPAVAELCAAVAAGGRGVLVFTGHTLAEARALPGFDRLWASVDTLVDGRFDARMPEPDPGIGGRRFLGSRNQVIHHRSSRYADADLWTGQNRGELRIEADGRVSVHGFPEQTRALLRLLQGPQLASTSTKRS